MVETVYSSLNYSTKYVAGSLRIVLFMDGFLNGGRNIAYHTGDFPPCPTTYPHSALFPMLLF